ncbi:MAG: hypothetical protein D5S00_09925, partial [Tindallia sp. MSAO_Bac2]
RKLLSSILWITHSNLPIELKLYQKLRILLTWKPMTVLTENPVHGRQFTARPRRGAEPVL